MSCLCACIFPCCAAGSINDFASPGSYAPGFCMECCCPIGTGCFVTPAFRNKENIPGDSMTDFFLTCCCHCCMLSRMLHQANDG